MGKKQHKNPARPKQPRSRYQAGGGPLNRLPGEAEDEEWEIIWQINRISQSIGKKGPGYQINVNIEWPSEPLFPISETDNDDPER